jgi:phosphoribosylformylglycinamidine synthase
VPPGENAGVVDIGDDWCVAFKVESHNHPSFIEPFQGAATGVGGILRDVFTMGARPIAAMNSLRFGPLTSDQKKLDNGTSRATKKIANRNKSILKGVVEGIAHYGNCFGVPTIAGEVVFDEAYSLNPLVNAFALGLLRKDQIFFGKASGIGNPVLYVGAKTGRDGIHGATMASAEFDDEALEKRPTVQVGDPFLEKLLLEACLEAMRSGAIEGIQDMGAAGLTSSSVEMADRAGTGLELDLTLVPQREENMTAYEMLLSESQERMLIVAKAGREKELVEIFSKWDLDAVVIGNVVEGNRFKVIHHGELMADLPVDKLTDEAPLYERPMAAPEVTPPATSPFVDSELNDRDFKSDLLTLLKSPNICSKRFVYQQYDHMVRTNTAVLPGADAGVVRIKETRRAVSMCLDGNGRIASVNPKEGARLTVAEAARNNVCVGAKPIAVTNCLNFASPERPKIMWAFSETIDGIKEACEKFDTPVISGNVSFYNETDGDGVLPTPTIGMVGLLEDVRKIITQGFKNEGDVIALLGPTEVTLAASEFAQTVLDMSTSEMINYGQTPVVDLDVEKNVQTACLELSGKGLINSAHDCSDGGIATAIAEQCFSSLNNAPNGAVIDLKQSGSNLSEMLFGEGASRIIVTCSADDLESVKTEATITGSELTVIGKVGGDRLSVSVNGAMTLDAEVGTLQNAWANSLDTILDFE